jgi:hypothetical protein
VVCLTPVFAHGSDRLVGFHLGHEIPGHPSDDWCFGYIRLQESYGRPVWEMFGSLEEGTLTLDPSITCHTSGVPDFHGYVVDGRWVPAP